MRRAWAERPGQRAWSHWSSSSFWAWARAWGLATTVATAGGLACATVPRHGPSAPFEARGTPGDATIWIDDRMMGTVAELTRSPRRIAAGFHRVEIRCPGFESHFEELDVKPEFPQVVRFELHEVLQ